MDMAYTVLTQYRANVQNIIRPNWTICIGPIPRCYQWSYGFNCLEASISGISLWKSLVIELDLTVLY